jgi:biotin transporter BioY
MVDIGKIERKIDKGASIIWFGAIFAGMVILVIGLLWFMDVQGWIDIDIYTVCAVFLVMAGIGVIGIGMWLRSFIKA